MKQVILMATLFMSVYTFAQKKCQQKSEFSATQKTQLLIKKMTIELDLNAKQVSQITPIVNERIKTREAKCSEDKKENRKLLSSDEKFEMKMEYLNKQETLQNKMKNILKKEQYISWKELFKKHHHKKRMAKKVMHKKNTCRKEA